MTQHIVVGVKEALGLILTNLDALTERVYLMATKAEIEQMYAEQTDVLTDYITDVTAQMATMNTKLDAALANDSVDAAQIAELKQITDDVITRGTAITNAIKAADVAVDQPAP